MADRIEDERILVLAPLGRDAEVLCRLLAGGGLSAEACRDPGDLAARLRQGAGWRPLARRWPPWRTRAATPCSGPAPRWPGWAGGSKAGRRSWSWRSGQGRRWPTWSASSTTSAATPPRSGSTPGPAILGESG